MKHTPYKQRLLDRGDYLVAPQDIFDVGLSCAAIAVYIYFGSHTSRFNPSQYLTSKKLRLDRKTIRAAICELEGAGLLKLTRSRGGLRHKFDLMLPEDNQGKRHPGSKTDQEKPLPGLGETAPHYQGKLHPGVGETAPHNNSKLPDHDQSTYQSKTTAQPAKGSAGAYEGSDWAVDRDAWMKGISTTEEVISNMRGRLTAERFDGLVSSFAQRVSKEPAFKPLLSALREKRSYIVAA